MMIKSKVREYWERYVYNVGHYGVRHLVDVYNKCSSTKKVAWEHIAAECVSNKGFRLSVITYSAQYFTAGYMYKEGDKLMFRVHTSSDCGIMEIGMNEKIDAVQHNVLK